MMRLLSLATVALLSGCAAGADHGIPNLENTLWTLTSLIGHAVAAGEGRRPPTITLQSDGKRVSGFTGCNQMAGSYTRDYSELRFGQMMSTRMACLDGGMMETERTFTDVLQRVRSWSISGNRLTLSDAAGAPLAVFEARQAK